MTLELMILIVNILLFPNGDIFSNKNLYTTSPPSSLLPIKISYHPSILLSRFDD